MKMKAILALMVVASLTAGRAGAQEHRPASVWESRKSAWDALTPADRSAVNAFGEHYKDYLRVARSALTSTREVLRQAHAAGFTDFRDNAQVKPGARLAINARDRAVILVVVGSETLASGSRVVGTHHDSPHIDLKGRPIYPANGFALFKTIYYGGIKKYQWANLPLALIGRVDTTDGRTVDISIGLKDGDPVFAIPDNAPHSDKELRNRTYQEIFGGEELEPVAGSIPSADGSVTAAVMQQLATTYNIREEDFVSAELQLVPSAPPSDVGIDRGLVGAYGQDDRLSSYCAARSILDVKGTPRYTALAYLSNFEEEGSINNTGAASALLSSAYARLLGAERGKAYTDLDLRTALRNAQVISADTNDGVNPVFPQTTEASNAARLGYGVTIKRYGRGFDANSEFIARIRSILDRNGIPWQTHTPRVDVGSGGTIGGYMSAQDMEVIDMGVPLLSMHSPFEMSSKVDVWNFYRLMLAFYGS